MQSSAFTASGSAVGFLVMSGEKMSKISLKISMTNLWLNNSVIKLAVLQIECNVLHLRFFF